VAAPVFQRVTQQVLEYLHVAHDVALPPNRQVWLAQNRVKDSDLDESSPDHLGSALELSEAASVDPTPSSVPPASSAVHQGPIVAAALREREAVALAPPVTPAGSDASAAARAPASSTVVLDVEQGGIEVPSFIGKSVRGAIEAAQDSGLELNPVGSGLAREQSPAPGTRVTAGAKVVVRFGR
jgi:cell division protein FtsI (penicillin-binding protein 3)